MTYTSYMDRLYNHTRYQAHPQSVQPFFPWYTLPAVAQYAKPSDAAPPGAGNHVFAGFGAHDALGATIVIGTPFGKQSFNIPVEQLASTAAKSAVAAAWPEVQKRVNAELPRLMSKAIKQVRPELRSEMDRAVDIGSARAAMIATGVSLVVIASAWWIKRGR